MKIQKREAIANLLINKFRGKYNVVATPDSEIDQMIREEVYLLLQSGKSYDVGL